MSRRHRRGSAAAEFVLTLGALVSSVFGVVEIGHMQDLGLLLTSAASDAAVRGADTLEATQPPTGASVEAAAEARGLAALADAGITCGVGCSVTATWTTVGGWQAVSVTVEVPYDAWTHLPFAPGSMQRTSVTVTRQQALP